MYTTFGAASDLLTQTCLAVAGFDETYPSRLDYPSDSVTHYSFGVWTTSRASQYGFAPAPMPAELAAFGAHLALVSPDERAALDACIAQPETDQLNDAMESTGIASQADLQSWGAMEADPRSAAVFELRRDCLASKGYNAGDDLTVAGVDAMTHDEQVGAALADVDCKTQTGFVQKLADIAAGYQLDFIAQNEAQLTAEKAELDALLARAEQILAPKQ